VLLIDTDNALGSPRGDVDDAFALAFLLRSGLSVTGVVSVAGNTGEEQADRNNRTLGELCGYRGLYLRGARARTGPRVDRVPEVWAGLGAPLRAVALGPLTNVAAILAEAARTGRTLRLAEVVTVGSDSSSHGFLPPLWPHEFNLTYDRRAFHAVFRSEVPLTLVPLDVARRLLLGRRDLERLDGPLGETLRRGSERWLRRARLLRGARSFPAFDLLAAAYVVDPSLVTVVDARARLHPGPRLVFSYGPGPGRPVRLVRGFDGDAIRRRLAALVNGAAAAPQESVAPEHPAAAAQPRRR
jgi:inosine-uridine nucleoside N-ribohydrolase